ncbi:hypothetical protein JCM9279_006903 [Rhodotorula babjevae]
MDQLPPAFDFGSFSPPAGGPDQRGGGGGGGTAFDSAGYGAGQQPVDAGLSQDDLAWLEAQLSLAAQHASPPPPPPQPTSFAPLASPNGTETYVHQPHAFPPVSSSKYHPYSLPPDRARRIRPPGPSAHLNLVQPQHQPAQYHQPPHQHQQPQQYYQGSSGYSAAPAQGGLDALQWPSFSSFASSFAPVAAPPAPPAHYSPSTTSCHVAPTAKQLGSVLYPPQDAPSPVLLPDAPTPTYPAAPHASPATPSTIPRTHTSPLPSPPVVNGHGKAMAWPGSAATTGDTRPRPQRPRARSAPPALAPPSSFPRVAAPPPSPPRARPRKAQQLSELFAWLDAQRWSFATLFSALSDLEGSPAEHERRLGEFLEMDEPLSAPVDVGDGPTDGARLLREAKRRWALKRRQDKGKGREDGDPGVEDGEVEERGPDEVVRMWEEQGGLGRRREGTMAKAVRELHSNVHDGAVAGSVIRRIINRYGEAYKESSTDIERLDAALKRPPSPHLTSAPREAAVWTGTLVLPPTQADVLQAWLMSPGRPSLGGKIDPEHMRIYSSLSPLDLHARGAELCRVILLRDAECMRLYGHYFDRLQSFKIGPVIAAIDSCGFSTYDEQSLWHHALQTYLQLCVRYPPFREGKDAKITILPDLPPPVHPTPLETLLIDRALHDHWEHLRVFLLDSHGGLLRSAVRAFNGVKLSKFDLLSVCDDTRAVMLALDRSKKNPSERFLPYDPAISQIRNAWRQQAYYDKTADLVVWSAATTHFLEISALHPDFALGVSQLPGLEALLGGKAAANGAVAMQH